MLSDVLHALRDVFSPALRRVMWKSLGLSLVVLALFGVVAQWALGHLPPSGVAWLDLILEWVLRFFALIVLIPLVQPTVSLVAGLFLETAASALEEKNYPADPQGRDQPFWQSLRVAIRFTLLLIILNLLALPFYLVPMLNVVLFWSLNGYLLGREYFEMVALRHHSPAEASDLRRSGRLRVFITGICMAIFASVPLLNLLTPLFATALMVHTYKRLTPHAPV